MSADEVYDVLVEECGAPDDEDTRASFVRSWPCAEWRFSGAVGFGGEVRGSYVRPFGDSDLVVRVDCYPEDMNDERRKMIDAANARLR